MTRILSLNELLKLERANKKLSKTNADLLEACEDAKWRIKMMVGRMPLDKLVASDSITISQLQQAINKAKGE